MACFINGFSFIRRVFPIASSQRQEQCSSGFARMRIRSGSFQRRNGCIYRGMILAVVHDKQKEKKHGDYQKT